MVPDVVEDASDGDRERRNLESSRRGVSCDAKRGGHVNSSLSVSLELPRDDDKVSSGFTCGARVGERKVGNLKGICTWWFTRHHHMREKIKESRP